jgi:hypothetical protein
MQSSEIDEDADGVNDYLVVRTSVPLTENESLTQLQMAIGIQFQLSVTITYFRVISELYHKVLFSYKSL